jgi:major membrane immunogen (membrane-anchored lipoprotein)
LNGEDLAALSPGKANLSNNLLAQALTLQNNSRALVWVKNSRYEAAVTDAMLGQPLHGLTLTLSGLKDGQYQMQWYDSSAGKWLDTVKVTAQNGKLNVGVPDFLRDIAARVTAP